MVVGIKIDHISGEVEELESEEIVQDVLEAFVQLVAGPMLMKKFKKDIEEEKENGKSKNPEREVQLNEYEEQSQNP